MKRIRVSKVRVTDHRPGAKPVVSGLDRLASIQAKDAADHDAWVAGYTPEMLAEAFEDLRARGAWDRKDPEHRWVMNRLAAIKRAAMRMRKGWAA